MVTGELLAGLVSPSLSPLTAVGGAVIDAVPPGVGSGGRLVVWVVGTSWVWPDGVG